MEGNCKDLMERGKRGRFLRLLGAVSCAVWMLLGGSAVTASGIDNWDMQCVAENSNINTQVLSMALDDNGNPGIVYASTAGVMFTYLDGGTWKCETVEAVSIGRGIAMGWDGNTWVVAYGNGDLKFAKRDPDTKSWSVQTVEKNNVYDNSKGLGVYTSNGKYRIGISYKKAGLCYAEYDGSSWTKTSIEKNAVATYNALDFDSAGQPAIAYSDQQNNYGQFLKYAKRSAGKWSTSTVASGTDKKYGVQIDIELDSNDHPYIVDDSGLYSNTGGGWTSEQVAGYAYHTSLALDESGGTVVPYVAYKNENSVRFVSTRINGEWVAETYEQKDPIGLGSWLKFFYKEDANNNIVEKKLDLGYPHQKGVVRSVFFAERDLLNPSTWG